MKHLEFYYDYASPYTYLAWTQVGEVARRQSAPLVSLPVLLGGLFKTVGNKPPIDVAAKGPYMLADLQLWAQHYGVPFHFTPYFPLNTLKAMRGALVAERRERRAEYDAACFRAAWVEGVNLTEVDAVADCAVAAGLDRQAFLSEIEDPAIKQQLLESTNRLAQRGAFGLPTFFVGDAMFFGNDRLLFVEQALQR